MNNKRASWSTSFGFIMSAVGSAVGLGNIWGFPYKMGKSGGFAFLVIYILLSLTVGIIMMTSELAIGRKTAKSPPGAYRALSEKFSFVGWLAVISPFLVVSFYTVLGAYCLQYMFLNVSHFIGLETAASGAQTFSQMLGRPEVTLVFTLFFIALCYFINSKGVSGGIESFNKVGMPALFVMLLVISVRSLTLPHAAEGLKYMFIPGYAVNAGFSQSNPSLITILATAGSQVFFSLSVAMGVLITYGSYLSREESLIKSSVIISVCDTAVALLAGLAIIPAAISTGISQGIPVNEIELDGPRLLYATLQDVFNSMGYWGFLFGILFYLLIVIAASTSAISLIEVITASFTDRRIERRQKPQRQKTLALVCLSVCAISSVVALDGLGTNGLWIPFLNSFGVIGSLNDSWLNFLIAISEGLLMPLGALIMSIMIAWKVKPKTLLTEIVPGGNSYFEKFYTFLIRFIAPAVILLVLLGQIDFVFGLGIFT